MGPRYSTIAVVVRDWRGELEFAGSMKVNTTLPLQVEAIAIRWAISLAPAIGGESVLVESDSQVVVPTSFEFGSAPLLGESSLYVRI